MSYKISLRVSLLHSSFVGKMPYWEPYIKQFTFVLTLLTHVIGAGGEGSGPNKAEVLDFTREGTSWQKKITSFLLLCCILLYFSKKRGNEFISFFKG